MGKLLVWLDLETTGLDPNSDDVLEIAVALSDFDDPFNLRQRRNLVIPWAGPIHRLYDVVREMHNKSGLFEDCRKACLDYPGITWRECAIHALRCAEDELLLDVPEDSVLAGSTVHFDKAFLKRDMPRLTDRFSHRLYDVSAVKLFAQSLGMPLLRKAEIHRALPDIEESARHGREVKNWFLTEVDRLRRCVLTMQPYVPESVLDSLVGD